jgi:hypothetical protein
MLQIPSDFVSNVFQTTSTTLKNFKGVIVLVLGAMILFWLLEEIIDWLQDTIENRENVEERISKLAKFFKVAGKARIERFEELVKKGKVARKALELRRRFKEVMAGEGVDIET